jgi:transcriptional regulator with XRE-family HTH domain
MKIIEDIDKLRKLSDKTISLLARNSKVTPAALSKFFQGKSDLGASKFIRVLEDLDIPLSESVLHKLRERTGLIDPDKNDLSKDFLTLFEKLNDIQKKIVLTSLVKPLSNSKEKDVLEASKRLKKRTSVL